MSIFKSSLVVAAALAVGCGGSQKTASELADNAPPPPSGQHKIERTVSKEAKTEFQKAVKVYEKNAGGGWTKAECKESAGAFEEVADEFSKLIEARFNAGLSYQQCGMMEDAESQYQAALKINPGHAASLSNLGLIYFIGGNEARGKSYWEKAVKANGKIPAARTNLAWLIIRQMRATSNRAEKKRLEEEAKTQLSSALAVENDNIEAYVLYALLYMEGAEKNHARLDLAKLLLDEGAKRSDDYAPLYNARGILLLKKNNVSQALAMFQKAVALDPELLEARMNVGNVVLSFRKYDEAAKQFSAILERDPKNYDALIGLGVAQRGLKKFDEAEASYTAAAKADPKRAEAYFNLGVLYKGFRANQQKDLAASKDSYQVALKHFRQAVSKENLSPADMKEAKANIEDCQKIIRQLDDIISQMAKQPAGAS
ncbi:MAG TPA: tetratricopeptide repeat protein [Kofleriaceae bacterium]|nr:tetratricopeptide repeat protein [Kofleriaceae bacterium]